MVAYLSLILSGVALNACAQLLLKQGMLGIGRFAFTLGGVLGVIPVVTGNPYIIAGLASYVLSVGIWLLVLSRVDVGVAYPFLSVGYVIVTIGGWFLFGEPVTPGRVLGIAMICLGVVLLARS